MTYALTERGSGLEEALQALRRWGVEFLTDPAADGTDRHDFDLHYVEGIDDLDEEEFGLVVDGRPSTLRLSGGRLVQIAGEPGAPTLVVHTSDRFMDGWAAGTSTWDDGLASGDVTVTGPEEAWTRWLAATGYLRAVSGGSSSPVQRDSTDVSSRA